MGGLFQTLDASEFYDEHECRVRRYRSSGRASLAVAHLRCNRQLTHLSDTHTHDTLIPAPDDPAGTQRKPEVRTPIDGAIKLRATKLVSLRIVQPASVVHDGRLARLRNCAIALNEGSAAESSRNLDGLDAGYIQIGGIRGNCLDALRRRFRIATCR